MRSRHLSRAVGVSVQGNKVHTLRGHTRAVCSLSYHPKTPSLLSASFDGTVRLWEMKSVDA
jgi:WD40 repeat protein